jgi:methylmalonyl-CoA/ethylmalonyl-CoA epimerase
MEEQNNTGEAERGVLGKPMELVQIGLVVRNLEETMEQYTKLMGWGPWKVYTHESPRHHSTRLRGEEVVYTMRHAECDVNGIGFELIEPLEGPSIYKEWLDEHGEGIQHIAVGVHDPEESQRFKDGFAKHGVTSMMDGRIDESIEYYYLDTQGPLKLIVEAGSGHVEGGALPFGPDYVYE